MNFQEIVAKLTGLDGEIASLKKENENLLSKISNIKPPIDADGLVIENAMLLAEKAKLTERVASLEASASIDLERNKTLEASLAKAKSETLEMASKLGVPPIEDARNTSPPAALSIENFEALNHAQRNIYIRSGGKILQSK